MKVFITILCLAFFIYACNREVKIVKIELDSLADDDIKSKSEMNNKSFDVLFDAWIGQITADEKPSRDIIAYKFGIFETPDFPSGYSIYLIGAKSYDSDDDDWAAGFGDFKPANAYLGLPEKEFKGLKWEAVQKLIEQKVKQFSQTTQFKKTFFNNSKAIAVGFDDGDLTKVY